ncbi:MAG: RNA-binding transcriptional accessory protein [Cytophagaceae bacterium]|jgi:uncharacterized protein|nr:RNA-binding transcriptional accessory protein [Cytophagaceae bacterium]
MSSNVHFSVIATELSVKEWQVKATAELLETGATVPFISRYRKEATGQLDEVQIAAVRDRLEQLRELDKRRESILASLSQMEKLSKELEEKILAASTLSQLEDLYLPYRPKRKTKASIAREKGLEPLAERMKQMQGTPEQAAEAFIDASKGVNSLEEALAGARDIMAEWISEDAPTREGMRTLFVSKGTFSTKVFPGKEEEGAKFKDYFEWQEPIAKAPSHRVLAMRRGEKEMVLMLDVLPPEEEALYLLEKNFLTNPRSAWADQMQLAIKDAYKRLLRPSMETEVRMQTKTKADEEAIRVFAENLRQLLLASPLGQKRVLAIDPGFRTGCKVVCLDQQGKMLHHFVIFPHEKNKQASTEAELRHVIKTYEIEAIALGNGTASRETEQFLKQLQPGVPLLVVNESGASVYSASDVARQEFPDYDVTVRGAVSIGRRLMDPLAELVKIDPKAIGVGQYQHDVDQNALKKSLDDVVMSCVNAVGVEVNTASKELLSYVSGLGPSLAQNIVEYRNSHGPFNSREALRKVPRLGDKAFEQAAGFLRIREAVHPLDASAVHPESYPLVERMATDLGCKLEDLLKQDALRKRIELKKYVSDQVGLPTLRDILNELEKPGRDPREKFEEFQFAEGINKPEDLRVGMKLPGIVTNITRFGAFVDVGVHQDGLVHVSEISDKFISDPAEVLKVSQRVEVTVTEVDLARKRISLSMKGASKQGPKPDKKREPQKEKELSMEDKLHQLKAKFGK